MFARSRKEYEDMMNPYFGQVIATQLTFFLLSKHQTDGATYFER